MARFLEGQPAFPKNRYGVVTNEAANRILTRLLYAGMVEGPEGWDVSVREGRHKGLVRYETFLKAQDRPSGKAIAPARALRRLNALISAYIAAIFLAFAENIGHNLRMRYGE